MPRIDPRLRAVFLHKTANQELVDRAIRHSLYLERLKTGEAAAITKFLQERVVPDVHAKLSTRLEAIAGGKREVIGTGAFTTARYRSMRTALATEVRAGVRRAHGWFEPRLQDIALSEAEWQAESVRKVFRPLDVNTVLPSQQVLRNITDETLIAGRPMLENFERMGATWVRRISGELRVGIVQGETVDQLARRIREGPTKRAGRDARAIARTGVNEANTRARQEVLQANGDVVKGWQYVATLDSRTTEICASLDGKVFGLDEGGSYYPPQHWNCRSTTVPVLKSWDELGFDKSLGLKEPGPGERPFSSITRQVRGQIEKLSGAERRALREHFTGTVPQKVSYINWMRNQPAAVQNEWLGPGKAALFRAGKYTPTFQNTAAAGRVRGMTLRELRKREGLDVELKPRPPKVDPNAPGSHLTGAQVRERILKDVAALDDELRAVQKQINDVPNRMEMARREFIRKHGGTRQDEIIGTGRLIDIKIEELNKRGIVGADVFKHPEFKQIDKLVDEFHEQVEGGIWQDLKRLQARREEIEKHAKAVGRKWLKVSDPIESEVLQLKPSTTRGRIKLEDRKEQIKEARAFFNSVVSRRTGVRKLRIEVEELTRSQTERQGYLGKAATKTVGLAPGADTKTVVHEFGHILEAQVENPIMLRNSAGFLRDRYLRGWRVRSAADTPWVREYMNNIYVQQKSGSWYKGPARFGDAANLTGTEVMSVGLEKLWENPAAFAKADPEAFDFVVDALRGRFRQRLVELGAQYRPDSLLTARRFGDIDFSEGMDAVWRRIGKAVGEAQPRKVYAVHGAERATIIQ